VLAFTDYPIRALSTVSSVVAADDGGGDCEDLLSHKALALDSRRRTRYLHSVK